MPEPGEVYWTLGDPRPCIVVSREELNRGDYIVGVLLTTQRVQERRSLPNCVPFQTGEFGLTKDCVAQAESITMIAKDNLDLARGRSGALTDERFRDLVRAIGHVISSDCEPV